MKAENTHLKILRGITSYHFCPDDLHSPYKAMMTLADGERTSIPEDLTDEELDLIEEEMREIKDLELLSRLADVLWIRRKKIDYAHLAIENYLKSAENLKNGTWFYCTERLERALRLSFSLGKGGNEYATQSIETIKSILEKNIPEDFGYFPLKLIELLLEFSDNSLDLCVSESEKYIRKLKDNEELKKYLELLAKIYERKKDINSANKCRVRIAENYLSTSSQEKSAMGRADNLQKAIEIFRKVGGQRHRIDEVHEQLLEVQKKIPGEMQKFSYQYDITNYVSQSRHNVTGCQIKEVLLRFCLIAYPTKFEEQKKHTEKMMNEFVFTRICNSYSVDKEGRKVAYIPSEGREKDEYERTLLARMVRDIITGWNLVVQGAILPAKDQIMLEHPLNLECMLPFTQNNPFVRSGRESLVAQGFQYGFQSHWEIAISLLIPQFEDAIRYILTSVGVITSRIEDDFKQEDRGINECFKNYSGELEKVFGKDTFFNLKCLLTKDNFGNGSNLRNRLAHGTMELSEFYACDTIYFWWLYFRIICIPLINQESKKNS